MAQFPVACKPKGPADSEVKYITISQAYGYNYSGLTEKVRNPKIVICGENIENGNPDANGEYLPQKIEKFISVWLDAFIAAGVQDKLASSYEHVAYQQGNQKSCDVIVTYDPKVSRAYCQVQAGAPPWVYIGDDQPSYPIDGTLAHEFGHAFGLGDTYFQPAPDPVTGVAATGKSGDCVEGQPDSLMCNTAYHEPQKDDKEGILEVYKKQFPDAKIGAMTDGGTGQTRTSGTGSGTGSGSGSGVGASVGSADNGHVPQGEACFCVPTTLSGRSACALMRGPESGGQRKLVTDLAAFGSGANVNCNASFCQEAFGKPKGEFCRNRFIEAPVDRSFNLAEDASSTFAKHVELGMYNRVDKANDPKACRCGWADENRNVCGVFTQTGVKALNEPIKAGVSCGLRECTQALGNSLKQRGELTKEQQALRGKIDVKNCDADIWYSADPTPRAI